MTNYAIRVTRPYAQIASWISSLALKCDKLVVVQHDENVSKIHCHVHVVGFTSHSDTITNTLEKALNIAKSDKDQRGNSLLSKKVTYGKDKTPVDDKNISYMSKGKYDAQYIKGYTAEEYTALKAQGYDKKDYHEGDKESPNAVYFRQFEAWFHCQPWTEMPIFNGLDHCNEFETIKSYAWKYAAEKNQFVIDQKSRHKFQMLVWTYSFRYDIKIPKNEMKWQI